MLQVGDEVVIMSAPGRFTVTAVDGQLVTIENPEGIRKTVLEAERASPRKAKGDVI